jgi:Ca2+:H+ antiporter
MNRFLKAENILHSLLIFIPVAAILHYAKLVDPVWIFFTSGLAIIPLAGLLCNATERLADKVGQGLGGFLNATFGNAPELIISAMALREGLFDVVKASLTGSIIGNILLVFGTSALVGGCRHSVLYFNRTAATTGTTMLALSAIGLLLPATFNYVVRDTTAVLEQKLSLYISIVLLSTYILNLLFALKTHKHLYAGMTDSDSPEAQILENAETDLPEENKDWIGRSAWTAGALLAVSAFLIAWMSEILVGSVEGAAVRMGMNQVFIGVIFVAVIGNAAEHSTAIVMAMKNKMDIAINITVGSSIQIALFVAPLLILLSYFIAPVPMDLRFSTLEVIAVVLSVAVMSLTSHDGDVNWLEGVQLIAVYLMLAITLYFLR